MSVDGLSALQGTQAFIATDLTKRTQSFYALTLSVNVICTSAYSSHHPLLALVSLTCPPVLIAVRIRTIQRQTAVVQSMSSQGAGHTSNLTRIVTMLIESCACLSSVVLQECQTLTRWGRRRLLRAPLPAHRPLRGRLAWHVRRARPGTLLP